VNETMKTIATPSSAITEWLTMLSDVTRRNGLPEGYHYAGIGDFLMQHGVWYEPKPLPSRIRRGSLKQCFYNALALSKRRGYTYVEGYATPDIENLYFPAHHAWNLDHDGNLIDNTWEKTGLAYFGVAFPLSVANEAIRHDGNTVLDNPRARYELFRTPFCEVAGMTP
jgi:hypothetical protein